jgi:para-nitrobenzyl esterase
MIHKNRQGSGASGKRTWRATLVVGTLLAAGLGMGPAVAHDDHDDHDRGSVVRTDNGEVRGFTKDGVHRFLGIPYAAPPVGDLRWRPPQPAKKWKGTLDATKFADICPQISTIAVFAGPTSVTEDCLYLNVFTTGKSHKKKPVVVWIHGGGSFTGASNDYDGSALAKGGPYGTETVVVVINFRLGLLGFISHPALNAERHVWGNYGILDSQAALKWVQRNIEAFGGDPSRVLVAGESGGAVNTAANLVSPLAKGLFNRALMQSTFIPGFGAGDAALTRGTGFAEAANCPGSGPAAAACLRKLSPARILQLQGTMVTNGPFSTNTGVFIDGTVIPLNAADAYTSGQFNKMPVMGGATHDEGAFQVGIIEYFTFGFDSPTFKPLTAAQYEATTAPATLARYPLSAYGNDPVLARIRSSSDAIHCGNIRTARMLAQHVPTYWYQFNYQNAPYPFPKMPAYRSYAAHTSDIQFTFPDFHGGQLGVNLDQLTGQPRGLNGPERKLFDQMVGQWTNFAATGNPNGQGNAPWPRFTPSSEVALTQDIPLGVLTANQVRANHKCDFWAPDL